MEISKQAFRELLDSDELIKFVEKHQVVKIPEEGIVLVSVEQYNWLLNASRELELYDE